MVSKKKNAFSGLQKKKRLKRFFRPNHDMYFTTSEPSFLWGGCLQFFTKNRPQRHKKRAILHTSQANGGLHPPPRPPGYATDCTLHCGWFVLCAGPQREIFPGGTKVDTGPPNVIGAHAVKSFFVPAPNLRKFFFRFLPKIR